MTPAAQSILITTTEAFAAKVEAAVRSPAFDAEHRGGPLRPLGATTAR